MGEEARLKAERREARLADGSPAAPVSRALMIVVAAGVTLAAVLVAAVVATGDSDGGSAGPSAGLPGLQTGQPPWYAEQEQLPARLEAIGVPFSAMEGTTVHIHPKLRVFVSGEPVEVPKDIGISYAEQAMAALHTHDTAGTIHVESPVARDYTLGQFFDVWGVRLTRRCLGGYCTGGDKQLRAFAAGKALSDPRKVKLVDAQPLVVAFGTKAQVAAAAGR